MEPLAYDVVLADGATARIRLITPEDAAALAALHDRQSDLSRYRRYFSSKPHLSDDELRRFTSVDLVTSAGLVVEDSGELIAWGTYHRWPGRPDADVAFLVDDAHHGRGIATLLLEHLAAIAMASGIQRFTAETLADNRAMLGVFARAGWPVQRSYESGIVDLVWDLADSPDYRATVTDREQRADSRSVARLLLPRSIAVIGASDRAGTVGEVLWRNVSTSFSGPLFAVNPNRTHVGTVPCVPTVADIEADVWLAIVAVPAASLLEVVHQCATHRVRGVVVITSVDGTDVDPAEVVDVARSHGMRLVGPSSMGVASNAPGAQWHASLAPGFLPPGGVAFSLQSGSLGASVLERASRLQMGASWFVSLGDRADLSGNDVLQFLADDSTTSLVAMYTESFGNPRKFARIARRFARTRPIVAVAAAFAPDDPAADALFQQAGVLRVPTVSSLLDTARTLVTMPTPTSDVVAVISNSRSVGVLARQALEAAGLVALPVALRVDADAADYALALASADGDTSVGSVMVIHAPPVMDGIADAVAAIDAVARASAKGLVAVVLGDGDGPLAPGSPIQRFAFPEPAAQVLARAWQRAVWLADAGDDPAEPFSADELDTIVTGLQDHHGHLVPEALCAVLERAGMTVATTRRVRGAAEVTAAAAEIGYPVALKAPARGVGRSARSGIALDLHDADALGHALADMADLLGGSGEVDVQAMVPPGIEARVAVRRHPVLGPVVEVGLGGVMTDVIGDRTVRLAPLPRSVAHSMVAVSRLGAALERAGIGTGDLAEVLVRLAHLADQVDRIGAVDLNPLMVTAQGCFVVDASMELVDPLGEPPLRHVR